MAYFPPPRQHPLAGFLAGFLGAYQPARTARREQRIDDEERRQRAEERRFIRDQQQRQSQIGPTQRLLEAAMQHYPGRRMELMQRYAGLQQQRLPFVEGAGPVPVPEGIANPFAGIDFTGASAEEIDQKRWRERQEYERTEADRRDLRDFEQQKAIIGLNQQGRTEADERRFLFQGQMKAMTTAAQRGDKRAQRWLQLATTGMTQGIQPEALDDWVNARMASMEGGMAPGAPAVPTADQPVGEEAILGSLLGRLGAPGVPTAPGAALPPPRGPVYPFPLGTRAQAGIRQGDARVEQGAQRVAQGAERIGLTREGLDLRREAQQLRAQTDERRLKAMEERNSLYARRINSQISNEAFDREMKRKEFQLDQEVKRGRLELDRQKGTGGKSNPELSAVQKDIDAIQSQRAPLIKQLLGIAPGSPQANQVYAEVRRLDQALEAKISRRNEIIGTAPTQGGAGTSTDPKARKRAYIAALKKAGATQAQINQLVNSKQW
jgi:hypothetical protein